MNTTTQQAMAPLARGYCTHAHHAPTAQSKLGACEFDRDMLLQAILPSACGCCTHAYHVPAA